MNPPSKDMKDILAGNSALALTVDTDLFYAEMPDTPDACVCIYDTPGFPADPHQTYERPTVQVRIRGAKGGYDAAQLQGQAIRDLLNGLNEETWNSARYIGIWATGDVGFVYFDDNRRPVFTVNFRIHRTNG